MSGYKKHWIESFTGQVILDAMPEVAYVFNKDLEMLMWNKNTEKVLGYTADELYRKKVIEFVEEDRYKENEEAFEDLFSTHEQQVITQNLLTKTGEKIPMLDAANYATIDGEEYLIGLAIDISQLKKTEEELKNAIVELHKLKEKLQEENLYLREQYRGGYDDEEIIGVCKLTKKTKEQIEQVAPTNTTVLITGETGTQKKLYARQIHNKSHRKEYPLVMADCSKSSETMIESKLFGHEKGAINTAIQKRIGKVEMAHKGTLLLYEIGELSMVMQSKLYRVLNEGTFERIGSGKTKKVDLRIIVSTRYNLEELVRKGLFREDLYYKLNKYPIHISPLCDRLVDIPIFANHFLDIYNNKLGKNIERISKKTIKELQQYSWPGNIGELENVIERAVIISNGTLLKMEPLKESRKKLNQSDLIPLAEYERNYIIRVLEKTKWRVEGGKGAALILDMNPETLRSRMRKLEIKRPK